jgi:quercetin dioxygenase-like cupin family protein
MSKAGDIFENPVTGEYGYVRVGTEETDGELFIADLCVRPGGAVLGAHIHPNADERFTVVSGKLSYMKGGQKGILEPGESAEFPRGTVHDFWNAGDEDARAIVEVRPGARMELMIRTMFALAHEGKTDKKGMPNLLQMALISKEFEDVLQVMNPPLWIQRILFGVLSPIARLMGYKATYPHHLEMTFGTVAVEPLPEGIVIQGA